MELLGDMVRPSSGRKGREEPLSEANLLTPLPAAGPLETTEPPDIHYVLEAIHDLKVFIGGPPSPAAIDVETLRQATENMTASVDALRLDIRGHDDRNAESIRRIQEMQDAAGQLTRVVEASRTETAGLRNELGQTTGTGTDLQALDAWWDDFTRHVEALLATMKTAGEVPAADTDAGQETALRVEEALGVVVTTLQQHDEALRRNENSSLLTRKGVESLRTAFDKSRREHRLWRLAWVSPLVLLLTFAAGMLLESNVHWFYAWLSGR